MRPMRWAPPAAPHRVLGHPGSDLLSPRVMWAAGRAADSATDWRRRIATHHLRVCAGPIRGRLRAFGGGLGVG